MKRLIIPVAISLLGLNSFATTIVCSGAQIGGSQQGSPLVVEQDVLKKSPDKGVIFKIGDSQYLITISDIESQDANGTGKVFTKDAMVLSHIQGNKNLKSVVSDGKNLFLFDLDKNVTVGCKRD